MDIDNRGNVTGKNATTLVFDQKSQLTQIADSDTYAGDASGRRWYHDVLLLHSGRPAEVPVGSALSTSFVYPGSKLVGDNESVVLGAPATIGFDNMDSRQPISRFAGFAGGVSLSLVPGSC
jgi:hypothetical protein